MMVPVDKQYEINAQRDQCEDHTYSRATHSKLSHDYYANQQVSFLWLCTPESPDGFSNHEQISCHQDSSSHSNLPSSPCEE